MKTITVYARTSGPWDYKLDVWPHDDEAKQNKHKWHRVGEFDQQETETTKQFLLRLMLKNRWPTYGKLEDFTKEYYS